MKYKTKRKILRCISLTMAAVVTFLTAGSLEMEDVNARTVSEIKADQEALQSEIDDLDSELYDLVAAITDMQDSIDEMEAEITEMEAEIAEAEEEAAKQYASMKLRMQYMYENGSKSVLEIMVESGSISDFLNRVEYTNSIYEYDRQLLENYEATISEITDMKAGMEEEEMEIETEKASLVAEKSSLNEMIAERKGELGDINTELKEAEELARKKAELERQRQEAENGDGTSTSSVNTSNASAVSGGGCNPAHRTGVSGSDVVSYARTFVGYPYKWGGTDPTSGGADCSGFVQYVYKHFGITWGSRMTSASFRTVGQEVSYECMEPGDIVCYAGHVAIYAGGGIIVEAQSTKAGITCGRSVTCHKILAIRRVI